MAAGVLVLGAGLVGGEIARDLAEDESLDVLVVDRSPAVLSDLAEVTRCRTQAADLSTASALRTLVKGADLVVNAVPGALGYRTLQTILKTGHDVVDISFMPEDPRELDTLARDRGATAVVDAGVAPGLSHLMVGRLHALLGKLDAVRIQVGGLPEKPEPPWFYSAVFSTADVLEEYTRPARFIAGGALQECDPLSSVEPVVFPGLGELEAFDSDGLRTLLDTVPVRSMREQTLRYPGHLSQIKVLADEGLLSREPVTVGSTSIPQITATAEILSETWELPEDAGDLTALRVEVTGSSNGGRPERHAFEMLDRWDQETGATSMARTTGYTCTAIVRLMLAGKIKGPGVLPPEVLGRDEALFEAVLAHLAARGITIERSRNKL